MRRRIPLLLILGIVLILCALALVIFFQVRNHLGTQESRQIAAQLSENLPERTTGTSGLYPPGPMPVRELNSVDYVALVEVPAFGVTLPVANMWDSGRLAYAPARFHGSAYDNTLVIGGTDHPGQLDFCKKISHGDTVTVTDMTGARFTYTVARIDRAPHADSQWLMDEQWALTLFCRDAYSLEYIAVRCVSALP